MLKLEGGVAYPKIPPDKSHTHMFKYLSWSQGSIPPEEVDFIAFVCIENEVWLVCVLVIPLVNAPLGSTVAKQNSISVSAAIPCHTDGVMIASTFVLL